MGPDAGLPWSGNSNLGKATLGSYRYSWAAFLRKLFGAQQISCKTLQAPEAVHALRNSPEPGPKTCAFGQA